MNVMVCNSSILSTSSECNFMGPDCWPSWLERRRLVILAWSSLAVLTQPRIYRSALYWITSSNVYSFVFRLQLSTSDWSLIVPPKYRAYTCWAISIQPLPGPDWTGRHDLAADHNVCGCHRLPVWEAFDEIGECWVLCLDYTGSAL